MDSGRGVPLRGTSFCFLSLSTLHSPLLYAAAILAACAGPVRAACVEGVPEQNYLVVRRHDKIIQKDGTVLKGKITYYREGEDIEINIKGRSEWGRGMTRPVKRSTIKVIMRRQTRQQAFERELKEAEGEIIDLLALACECLRKKMYAEGITAVAAARRIKRSDYRVYLLDAQFQMALNKLGRAEDAVREVLRLRSGHVQARMLLVQILFARGDVDKAGGIIEEMLKADPNNVRVLLLAARARFAGGQYDEARKLFEKILDRQPSNAQALVGLGNVHLTMGKTVDADALFRRAYSADKRSAAALLGLGAVYYLQKNYDQARGILTRALNENPDSSDAFFMQGLCYLAQDQMADAETQLNYAVRESARNGRAQVALGYMRDLVGDTAGALEKYRLAAEQAPRDGYCQYVLGYAQYRTNDFEGAEASYGKVVKLSPRSVEALRAWGAALLKLKRYPEAVRVFRTAIQEGGTAPDLHSGLGLGYLGEGRGEKAVESLRKALAADPSNVQALLGLGYIANEAARQEEAVSHFRNALDVDGSNQYAVKALTKIYKQSGLLLQFFSFQDAIMPTGWTVTKGTERRYGLTAKPVAGAFQVSGTMKQTVGRNVEGYLHVPSGEFQRFGVDVDVAADTLTQAGIYIDNRRGSLLIAKDHTRKVVVKIRERGRWDTKINSMDWPPSGRLRLSIELVSEMRGEMRVYAGKQLLGQWVVGEFARRGNFKVALFTTAPKGQDVDVKFDNVVLITHDPNAAK